MGCLRTIIIIIIIGNGDRCICWTCSPSIIPVLVCWCAVRFSVSSPSSSDVFCCACATHSFVSVVYRFGLGDVVSVELKSVHLTLYHLTAILHSIVYNWFSLKKKRSHIFDVIFGQAIHTTYSATEKVAHLNQCQCFSSIREKKTRCFFLCAPLEII